MSEDRMILSENMVEKLFKMQGFDRAVIFYDGPVDRMGIRLFGHGRVYPDQELPRDYKSLPLAQFCEWVDATAAKLMGSHAPDDLLMKGAR